MLFEIKYGGRSRRWYRGVVVRRPHDGCTTFGLVFLATIIGSQGLRVLIKLKGLMTIEVKFKALRVLS